MAKLVSVSAKVPVELARLIDAEARRRGVSRSMMLRLLVTRALQDRASYAEIAVFVAWAARSYQAWRWPAVASELFDALEALMTRDVDLACSSLASAEVILERVLETGEGEQARRLKAAVSTAYEELGCREKVLKHVADALAAAGIDDELEVEVIGEG